MEQDTIRHLRTFFRSREMLSQTCFWLPSADIHRSHGGFFIKLDLAGGVAEVVSPVRLALEIKT